ncbi:uncharacterized protein LOC105422660 [Pogonomyrmex barbatus]|uniref:Uncharacterized protein LOC105422660 n=1 Tax=Pogonomyrmex barbatus TaxID=144034 RepID=A0A6I9VUK1_9HYME|nr:uncharacterized protein LOC105422660 [Pogonomyrmex barbatus]
MSRLVVVLNSSILISDSTASESGYRSGLSLAGRVKIFISIHNFRISSYCSHESGGSKGQGINPRRHGFKDHRGSQVPPRQGDAPRERVDRDSGNINPFMRVTNYMTRHLATLRES